MNITLHKWNNDHIIHTVTVDSSSIAEAVATAEAMLTPAERDRFTITGEITPGTWLIYRHGANAANQTMTPVMPVCIVTGAETPEAAIARAAQEINCYNNQFLSAVSEADCDSEDWKQVVEAEALLIDAGESDGLTFDATL